MLEILENVDWASFISGVVTVSVAILGWWKAIPQKKKDASKAIIEKALEDGNIDKNEAAKAALALM